MYIKSYYCAHIILTAEKHGCFFQPPGLAPPIAFGFGAPQSVGEGKRGFGNHGSDPRCLERCLPTFLRLGGSFSHVFCWDVLVGSKKS